MKKINTIALLLLLLTISGCEAIGDIFGAGFYTGIFVVVLVIVIIIVIISKVFNRK